MVEVERMQLIECGLAASPWADPLAWWIVKDSCVLSVVKDLLQNSPYFSHCLVHDGSLESHIHEMCTFRFKAIDEVLHKYLLWHLMWWPGFY